MNLIICVVAAPLVILAGSTGWLRHQFDAQGGWLATHGDWLEGAARLFFLVLAVGIALLMFGRLRERLAGETKVVETPVLPSISTLRRLQAAAVDGYQQDADAVALFVELIVDPGKFRSRLTEAIDHDERAVVQQVTVSFSLPLLDANGPLYLPVLQPLKGELVDNFHIRSAAGDSLTTLSYEESVQLAAAGLRLLLARMAPKATELDEALRLAEWALLQIIATRGPQVSPSEAAAANGNIWDLCAEVAEEKMDAILDGISFPDDESQRCVRKYVAALSSSYPIIAVVPSAELISRRVLVKYERTYIPSSLTATWRGLLRLGLGLRPDQVAVPLDLALTADSYHLRVNAPANKYVLKQVLQCRHCESLVERNWRGRRPIGKTDRCAHESGHATQSGHHFRVRRKRGQNFVHVYLRGYARQSPKMRDLALLARFKETPPGARGRAAVTALATTLLVAVVGNLVNTPQGAQVGGLPALMLALPAIAASWFGMTGDRETLVGGSLLARLSLITSGIVSVAAVVLYLGTSSTGATTTTQNDDVPAPLTFVGITDWRWITLCALSALNLIYISYRFSLKLVHYNDLIKRKDLGAGEFAWR
ncbi:hypothetical protein ABZX66_05145 [Micromonospora aurantiaca]|uniref:hypothetical protein n=1 Tax=Micromonospora aurantiaca (nom. illeg.) TaxID=47850 RepID=UPI0033A70167